MTAISVVIPTRHRAATLPTMLAPILADPTAADIIVVVDGDDDASHRVLAAMAVREPRLRAERGAGHGPGAARALGVEAATCPIVLLLDDDVVASPGLASGHAALHAADEALLVVGVLHHTAPTGPPDALYAEAYARWLGRCRADPTHLLAHLWLGHASLPRATALAVGLDEPRMRGVRHEDRDLGLRLRAAGVRAVLDESLGAAHHHRRGVAAFAADCRAEGAGLRRLHELHGTPRPRPLPAVPGASTLLCRGARSSIEACRLLRRYEIARGAAG